MSTAIFSTKQSEQIQQKVDLLLKWFPNKFSHINSTELEYVFKDSDVAKHAADISLIRGVLTAFSPRKLVLVVHRASWETGSDTQKLLVLYEQLLKIEYDDDKMKYTLRKPDVQTFSEMFQDFGSHLKAEAIFSAKAQG